jgi:predicted dehydrogenase
MRSRIDAGDIGNFLYFDSIRISPGLLQTDVNVIWDLAPHDFSVLDYLCAEDPVAVSASGAKHLGCSFENIAYVTVHFNTSAIASFHLSWLAPVKVRQMLVGGTKKMMVYDDMKAAEKLRIYDTGVTVSPDPEHRESILAGYRNGDLIAPNLDTSEALCLMAREFVDAIDQKRLPLTDGYAGYRVVRLLEAAQRSMQLSGKRIELRDAADRHKSTLAAFAIA